MVRAKWRRRKEGQKGGGRGRSEWGEEGGLIERGEEGVLICSGEDDRVGLVVYGIHISLPI